MSPLEEATRYMILPEYEQDSPEWHEGRQSGLGASEVAAILGLSPYLTPLQVYRYKMGIRNEIPENLAYFGHALEPVVAQWIRDKHPEVGTVTDQGISVRSIEHPWLTAKPDRIAITDDDDRPIELKTSSAFSRSKWDQGVPDYYKVQSIVQSGILGKDGGWLAVLHGGNDPELYWVPFEPDVWEQIVRITGEWWTAHVVAQVPPEPVTSAEAVELWPGDPDVSIEGSEALYELWGAYGLLQAEQVEIGNRLDGMKLELQKAMQDATALAYQGQELFTWRPRAGARRFDSTTFKKDHPDLAAQYTKQGEPTRTFLRKTVKEVEGNE